MENDLSPDTLIFVDRDGTINRIFGDGPIYDIDRFELLPRAAEAIALLNSARLRVALATNQGGIGHKDRNFDWERYYAIERKMHELLTREANAHVDAVFVCPHPDYDRCACRKPETGMFVAAQQRFTFKPERSYMIGDSDVDIVAGERFGLKTIWVRSGNARGSASGSQAPNWEAADLYEAAQIIVNDLGQNAEFEL